MPIPITSFNNVQIASNEAVDYYTLNRGFSRLYDAATTVSAYVNIPLSGTILYATLNSPGFVQFSNTVSGVSDNKIISSNSINTFINSEALTSTNTATYPTTSNPLFFVTSGGGQLFNNLTFQYGYVTIPEVINFHDTVFPTSLTIPFVTSGNMAFTQYPHIMYQILDSDGIKYKYTGVLANVATSGFNINITTTTIIQPHPVPVNPIKYEYYLTWLAIGV